MDIDIIETSPLERQVDITLGADRVEEESVQAFARLRRRVSIPGFRPGKVPQKELVRRYGKGVRAEVVGDLMKASISEALERDDLKEVVYLTPPELVDDSGQGGFSFRFRAELAPAINPQGYLGAKLVIEGKEINEETIDRQIDLMREEAAVFEPVEDRQVVAGDDYLTVSIKPVDPALQSEDLLLDHEMIQPNGQRQFEGLDEAVTGMTVGETREVTVGLTPDGRLARELGLEEVALSVQVHGIKRKVLPPVDDDLAKSVSRFETIEQLREDIRQRQLRAVQRDRKEQIRERLENLLLEKHPIELPAGYLKTRTEEYFAQQMERFQMAGLSREDLEGSRSSIHELVSETVKRRIRLEFILKAIAEREGIDVSAGEVERFLAEVARASGASGIRVQETFSDPNRRAMVEQQLRLDKTLDFLLSQTTILTEEESEARPEDAEPVVGEVAEGESGSEANSESGSEANSESGSEGGGAEPTDADGRIIPAGSESGE
ncbi:MAG: trigger factor [Bradymonadales bacterium]|nr:trigger factor [Bradymonadales bacterium]